MGQAGRHEWSLVVDLAGPPVSQGDRVGPYRLIERLGRGGMGEVWLAEDPTGAAGGAPRRVALKLLDPDLVDDRDARARFAREVAAARMVRGTSVASLLDADIEADRPWLASAYVAGPTLEEHVARHGPLAAGPLRALGFALADALVSIHAAGVVHRDLTPRNVVLGPDGPRVVDFGIAWFQDAPPITRVGSWVGTPAWMPPERLAGDRVTTASDVWSWGAVMAYAARGRPALGGTSPDVAAQSAPRGDREVAGVPGWLVVTVRAAMADDPAARPTAAQLCAAMTGGSPPQPDTVPDGVAPTRVASPPLRTVPQPADPTSVPDRPGQARRRGVDRPRVDRRVARWLSAAFVLGAAVAIGLVADLLVSVIATAVLVMVAVGLRLARERLPEGARPVPPTWAFGLAAPVVLGVALAQVLGPLGGAVALLVLIALFVLLGGDIG
jgi:serine/threonine protein kinase